MAKRQTERILRILLRAKGIDHFTKLAEEPLDLGTDPHQEQDGSVVAEAYVTDKRVAQLRKAGAEVDIIADQTAIGEKRQKQVGGGNSFTAQVPRGLGKKLKGDNHVSDH